jgi:hypothetical protein
VGRRILAPSGSDEPFYYSVEVHSGSSDHEVFNDWGVGVPGIMMIAWPDQWYHTSGDRPDKADPTQMKRVAAIGAAGAYTIASADAEMAMRIAGEMASNGTRRMGHAWIQAQNSLTNAGPATLNEAYQNALNRLETAEAFETAALRSLVELYGKDKTAQKYIESLLGTMQSTAFAHKKIIEEQMKMRANQLKCAPVKIVSTVDEKKAASMVPKRTSKVREMGYVGWRGYSREIPQAAKDKYPYSRREIASTSELQCLINGERNILEIKRYLDGQYPRASSLTAVMNYLYQLEAAGFVTFN